MEIKVTQNEDLLVKRVAEKVKERLENEVEFGFEFNREAFAEQVLQRLNESEEYRKEIAEMFSVIAYDLVGYTTRLSGLGTLGVTSKVLSNNCCCSKENSCSND